MKSAALMGMISKVSQTLALGAVAVAVLASANAQAAAKKSSNTPPPDVYAPVPTPELDFDRYQIPPSARTVFHFEADVSSWTPNQFTDESFVSSGGYKAGTPKISLNVWTGNWQYKGVNITPKYGVAYAQLTRQGDLGFYGQTLNATQVENLYSARAGLEVTPTVDLFGHLQPFVDVSLLPTWAQSPTSALAESSSRGYLSLEEVVGLNWHIPQLGALLGAENAGLEIGIEGTQGLAGSPLSGFGLLAGTRIEM